MFDRVLTMPLSLLAKLQSFSLQSTIYEMMGSFTDIFKGFWQLIRNTSGRLLQKRQMLETVLLKFMNHYISDVG